MALSVERGNMEIRSHVAISTRTNSVGNVKHPDVAPGYWAFFLFFIGCVTVSYRRCIRNARAAWRNNKGQSSKNEQKLVTQRRVTITQYIMRGKLLRFDTIPYSVFMTELYNGAPRKLGNF